MTNNKPLKLKNPKAEGKDLPPPKQTGICKFCNQPMYANRWYHMECLTDPNREQIDDDFAVL